MEPFTTVLAFVAKYGSRALIKSLGGSEEFAGAGGELGGGLASSLLTSMRDAESRIAAHLEVIDGKLDQVLEQQYQVSQTKGLRYLADSSMQDPLSRTSDLERARGCFLEARSASRSNLQAAISERYLMITYVALSRRDLAVEQVARVATQIVNAAIDALHVLKPYGGELDLETFTADSPSTLDNYEWREIGKFLVQRNEYGDFLGNVGYKESIGEVLNPMELLSRASEMGVWQKINPRARAREQKALSGSSARHDAARQLLSVLSDLMKELAVFAGELVPGTPVSTLQSGYEPAPDQSFASSKEANYSRSQIIDGLLRN
jgi:hypothetical protein